MRIILPAALCLLLTHCRSSGDKIIDIPVDSTYALTEVSDLPATAIPAGLNITGDVQQVKKWTDLLGENWLITSYTAPYDDMHPDGEEAQTAAVHAWHYTGTDTGYMLTWTVSDQVKQCPFDITASFLPGSITITDLDRDNISEIKLQYATACRSDVSPADMTLLLYEQEEKYSLRGTRWMATVPGQRFTVTEKDVNLADLPVQQDEYEQIMQAFGRYKSETDFKEAPPAFLLFARQEWLKYANEQPAENK